MSKGIKGVLAEIDDLKRRLSFKMNILIGVTFFFIIIISVAWIKS